MFVMTLKNVRLTYLRTKGLAEVIRYMLSAANVAFDDHRISGDQLTRLRESKAFYEATSVTMKGKKTLQV